MAFLEYMLAALLGTAGVASAGGTPGGSLTRSFTADAVTQPDGGTEGLLGQDTGGTTSKTTRGTHPFWRPGYYGRHHAQARRSHKGGTHRKLTTSGKKAKKS
jgi:hypothetical protein